MVTCPNCGEVNRGGSNFCGQCAAVLADAPTLEDSGSEEREPKPLVGRREGPTVYCAECGTANAERAQFCNHCGATLYEMTRQRLDEPEEEPQVAPEKAFEPAPEEMAARVPDEGRNLLAGISDPLPIAPGVTRHYFPRGEPPATTLEEIETARRLRDIATGREAPGAETEPAVQPRDRGWATRGIVYLLVMSAVVIPLFLDLQLPVSRGDRSEAQAFYEAVQELPSDAAVLVAFDYDASTAGEMDPLAETVTSHLMDRSARILAVSVRPQGPALAQRILEQAAGGHDEYEYGTDYVNLGYLPGGEAGLQAIARQNLAALGWDYKSNTLLKEQPLLQEVRWLEDVSLIVHLSGTREPLRWWLEQVQSLHNLPMVAAVSAAVEPNMWPYRRSGQLQGLLSGLPGTAQYEALTGRSAAAATRTDAQTMAHLALVGIILLGNAAGWIAGRGEG